MDLAGVICWVLWGYTLAMFGRVIMSWFPISPMSPMAKVYSFLYAVTEPVLGPIRRAIPPVGMGGMGLDLSSIIVIFVLTLLLRTVC